MTNNLYNPTPEREEILYELCGETETGELKVKFTNTDFNDIIFNVNGVSFEEVDDSAVMHYDYYVHEGSIPEDKVTVFEQLLGDFLVQAINRGVKDNSLIYTGGTDENRTDDTEQPGV